MRLPHTVLSQSGREVDSAWASSRRPDAEPTVDAVQHGATFMLGTPQPSAEVTATQACVHGTLVRDSAGLTGAGRHQRVKQVGCHRSGSPNPGGIDLSSARPAETTRLEATFRARRARPIASKRPGRAGCVRAVAAIAAQAAVGPDLAARGALPGFVTAEEFDSSVRPGDVASVTAQPPDRSHRPGDSDARPWASGREASLGISVDCRDNHELREIGHPTVLNSGSRQRDQGTAGRPRPVPLDDDRGPIEGGRCPHPESVLGRAPTPR